jgi:hypothetical protein
MPHRDGGQYGGDDTKTQNDCEIAHLWTDLPGGAGRGNDLLVLYAPSPGTASTIG